MMTVFTSVDRLYFVTLKKKPRSSPTVHYFSTDDEFVYNRLGSLCGSTVSSWQPLLLGHQSTKDDMITKCVFLMLFDSVASCNSMILHKSVLADVLGTFFNSFQKGPVICRGLDVNLSGKLAKNDSDTENRLPRPHCVPPSYRCVRNLSRCHRARQTLLPRRIYT